MFKIRNTGRQGKQSDSGRLMTKTVKNMSTSGKFVKNVRLAFCRIDRRPEEFPAKDGV